MSENLQKFFIEGKKKLAGTVQVSGSKNAALPILCAALLTKGTSTLTNVPDIADIHTMLEIFKHLNVKTEFQKGTVTVDATGLSEGKIPDALITRMRASILLIGPLLAKLGTAKLPFPGGCVLGKRSVASHTHTLRALGAEIMNETELLHLKVKKLQGAHIVMPEASVTGTENAIMLAAVTPGESHIRLAACEPHVQDLCLFLQKAGAKIRGIGTNFLTIEGVLSLNGTEHEITGDYLEAGTLAIASIITEGAVKIEGIETNQLDSLWEKFDEVGAQYQLTAHSVSLKPTPKLQSIGTLRTAVYPSFATDLQAPFGVLLTQADGESKIFETLFDGRLQYLYELEKMGAKVQVLNPHQAIIKGPTKLKGVPISSLDIRAGAAMVLAALCAEGTTEISNIKYIDRGYENLDGKLQKLGAHIKRV